jgi:hypothetical protein
LKTVLKTGFAVDILKTGFAVEVIREVTPTETKLKGFSLDTMLNEGLRFFLTISFNLSNMDPLIHVKHTIMHQNFMVWADLHLAVN